MATIAEQLTSLANTKTAIKQAIINKGVQVADDTPFSGYATKIGEISGGSATFLGLGYDQWVGVLDENGKLAQPTDVSELNIVELKDIGERAFYYRFYKDRRIESVNFLDLTTISGGSACYYMFSESLTLTHAGLQNLTTVSGDNACDRMFYNCKTLTSVGLQNLTTVSGKYACSYMFSFCTGLTSTGLQNLTTVSGDHACGNMFYKCTGLISTGLQNLTTISGIDGCSQMFYQCTGLTSTGLQNLTTVSNRQGCSYMFMGCTGLTSAGLENLTTVGGDFGCTNMFKDCTGLTKEYLPMLTTVTINNALGSNSSNGMFVNCANLTELHFRKDAQAVIEGLTGYQYKFGAENATIYFDLIGTITVDGVAYARDEKQSIRVDGVKTFVGWKDAGGNVVYTSYTNNAEPAVDTPVYSDAGITQVGTVSEVA